MSRDYKSLRNSYPKETVAIAKKLREIRNTPELLEYFKTHGKRKSYEGFYYTIDCSTPTHAESFISLFPKFRGTARFIVTIFGSRVIIVEGSLENPNFKKDIDKSIDRFFNGDDKEIPDEKKKRWLTKLDVFEKYIDRILKENKLPIPKEKEKVFSDCRKAISLSPTESEDVFDNGRFYEDFRLIEKENYPRVGLFYDWDKYGPQIYIQRKSKLAYGPWSYYLDYNYHDGECCEIIKGDLEDKLNGRNLFQEDSLRAKIKTLSEENNRN